MGRKTTVVAAITLGLAVCLHGCSHNAEPLVVSRTTLGTVVTVTAYGETSGIETAVDSAFTAMDDVSAELDAYSPDTPIARFNQDPYSARELPASAVTVLDALDRLGVADGFSPALLGVSALYGFESSETVPSDASLANAVAASLMFSRDGEIASFGVTGDQNVPLPGLDFGGAAKGLGLDLALDKLRNGAVGAAVVSAGSSTVTLGEKPGGEPWRIGIEDPRDDGRVLAVVEALVPCAVSTSGDYQRYFESGGVRYHHILDPATGAPVRGLRSLTVFGPLDTFSGLDADILSTALFVMGAEKAEGYAHAHGLGLYMVDAEGRALVVPAPESSGVRLVIEAEPVR
ncbi:MAG: FAD:protein FMN transferase [Coriobacteriia bacterium]|nr:FAD:protein FMN transferase [Coriobacteriia bacterium]